MRVNGRPARKGTIVRGGDAITLPAWPERSAPPAVDVIPLAIVHQDAELVVVDKPPGIPSTIGKTAGPSVAASLLARFPEMAAIDAARGGGLAHRLDTGTSGLLIAARTTTAYARLRREFAAKAITKEYLAVVHGRLARAAVATEPLARHPRRRSRMVVARAGARAWPARTEVTPLIADDDYSLVRLEMRTGVTHQLRFHLARLGHPVLGDRRYGDETRDATVGAGWHYLHARRVAFDATDLPRGLATPFPDHWRPLFAERRWSIEKLSR